MGRMVDSCAVSAAIERRPHRSGDAQAWGGLARAVSAAIERRPH